MTRSYTQQPSQKASGSSIHTGSEPDFLQEPTADKTAQSSLEKNIIFAELIEDKSETTLSANQDESVLFEDEVKALSPSISSPKWWRLKSSEQEHLLFNGHPNHSGFQERLPARIGVWLACPPRPSEWLAPPPGAIIEAALSYCSIYQGINLKAIRQTIEGLLQEIVSEGDGDDTAILAYLPDAPLLALLDDFGLDCYIAEPNETQCQEILSTWQQLGGEVSQLE